MGALFSGPRLKIERANQHINALDAVLNRFIQSDFYYLSVKKNADTGNDVLHFEITQKLPRETALIIGDAVHNLRASLDLAVWDSIRQAGGAPNDKCLLPFNKTKKGLESSVKDKLKKIASKDICDFIINEIKPYAGGNNSLYDLHQLDIIDKHRLLLPILEVTALTGVCVETDTGNKFIDLTLYISGGSVLQPIKTTGNLKITNKGQPVFRVFFDTGLPYQGEPIVPTLKQLSEIVSGIVDKFQNLPHPSTKT